MKVKCKGEDGVESTWEVSPRPNRGAYRRRRGFPLLTSLLIVGRTWLERWRRQDQVLNSVTALDAAILGAQVAGDACIFARVEVDAAIFGLCKGRPMRG